MSVIHTPREPDLDARHVVSLVAIGICLALVFLRLWFLQVVQHQVFAEKADANRLSSVTRPAPRGLVYDRTEKTLLAGVKTRIVVTARFRVVKKNPWVLDKLSTMLAVPREKLLAALKAGEWRPYLPVSIFQGATVAQATRIAEAGDALPGVGIDMQPVRFYPDPVDFCHVLGYVWTPDEDDVSRLDDLGVKPADYVGKMGLEYTYETQLMGTPGAERAEVDARRRPVRVIGRDNPVPGDRLILTIDARLQKSAIKLLGGKRGAVVMLDPRNGEVLCLVSSPVYDVSLFEGGISQQDFDRLNGDKSAPLLNRATRGYYSPGSTFKLVDTLAAGATGQFSPYRTYTCPGFYKVGNRRVACLGRHGTISFQTALAKSCNTYFASWADQLGPDAIRDMAFKVGLGEKTGIDLRSEGPGLVPTQEWLAKHRAEAKWYRGDTVNMGIGQGFLRVTPLQLACVAALVGNRGVSYAPHFVKSVVLPGQRPRRKDVEPTVAHEVEEPDQVWSSLRDAMVQAVEAGTATRAQIPGLTWAGKTGSTEHHRGKKTHGWYIGFAPANSPTVAISVLVEESGHGGEVSAPIARELVAQYFEIQRAESASRNKVAARSTSAAGRPNSR